jgi:hypothetical protein
MKVGLLILPRRISRFPGAFSQRDWRSPVVRGGADEGLEEGGLVEVGVGHALGMPLDGQEHGVGPLVR